MGPTSRHGVPARCLRASATPRLAPAALPAALFIACSKVNVLTPKSCHAEPARRAAGIRRAAAGAGGAAGRMLGAPAGAQRPRRRRRARRPRRAVPPARPGPAAAAGDAAVAGGAGRRGRGVAGRAAGRACALGAPTPHGMSTRHTGPSEVCLEVLSRSLVKSVLACRVPLHAWQSHARGLHACSLSAGGRRRIHPPAAAVPPHHCMCWVVTMAA